MSLVPDRLEEWTLDTVEALCAVGLGEGDRHDFKAGLQNPSNATKLCCSFANSNGGFLIYGVSESGSTGFKIEGMLPDTELGGKLRQKIQAEPQIELLGPKQLELSEGKRFLYIFHVPRSAVRPHLPLVSEQRFFWKRVNSQCERMTLEEIRYQMLTYEEKVEKLTLLVIDLHSKLGTLAMQNGMPSGHYSGVTFDFTVIDRVLVESYSLLKTEPQLFVWVDELKGSLMLLNYEKQKLAGYLSLSYNIEDKTREVDRYTTHVCNSFQRNALLISSVTKRLHQLYGVESPYPRPSGLSDTIIGG